MTFNPVVTAGALNKLNGLSKKSGTSAAFAYLKGEYPDMSDLLESIEIFIADTGGDPHDRDAYGIADNVCKAAAEFAESCDLEAA